MRLQVAIAALFGLLLTAAGAIGAHALPERTASWDSAILFGFVHVVTVVAANALPATRFRAASAWLFVAGVALFSLTIIVRALAAAQGGDPLSAIGPLAPIGGFSFMAGWIALGLAALRSQG